MLSAPPTTHLLTVTVSSRMLLLCSSWTGLKPFYALATSTSESRGWSCQEETVTLTPVLVTTLGAGLGEALLEVEVGEDLLGEEVHLLPVCSSLEFWFLLWDWFWYWFYIYKAINSPIYYLLFYFMLLVFLNIFWINVWNFLCISFILFFWKFILTIYGFMVSILAKGCILLEDFPSL